MSIWDPGSPLTQTTVPSRAAMVVSAAAGAAHASSAAAVRASRQRRCMPPASASAACNGPHKGVASPHPSVSVPFMAMDCTYRLRIPHTAGQLAKVATTIAELGGLIGDVTTINVARHEELRGVPVALRDRPHADELAAALGALPGVTVSWFHDRAFIAHDGGKLDVVARTPIRSNQDVRDVYTPGVARVSTAIAEFPDLARRFTMIGRSVAI